MKKNSKIIVIIGLILLISLSASYVAIASSPSIMSLFDLGKTPADTSSGNDAEDETVAVVYGVKISSEMLAQKRLLNQRATDESLANLEKDDKLSKEQKEDMKQQIKNKTDKELLLELVTNIVISNEIKKLGIEVSKEEASAELDKAIAIREDLLKNGDQTQKEAVQMGIDSEKALYNGLGYTKAQIRESQINGYIQILLRDKFYDHFVSTLPEGKRKDYDYIKTEYNSYKQKLVDKSDVQYFINLN